MRRVMSTPIVVMLTFLPFIPQDIGYAGILGNQVATAADGVALACEAMTVYMLNTSVTSTPPGMQATATTASGGVTSRALGWVCRQFDDPTSFPDQVPPVLSHVLKADSLHLNERTCEPSLRGPTIMAAAPGTLVWILGEGFSVSPEENVVTFGGQAAEVLDPMTIPNTSVLGVVVPLTFLTPPFVLPVTVSVGVRVRGVQSNQLPFTVLAEPPPPGPPGVLAFPFLDALHEFGDGLRRADWNAIISQEDPTIGPALRNLYLGQMVCAGTRFMELRPAMLEVAPTEALRVIDRVLSLSPEVLSWIEVAIAALAEAPQLSVHEEGMPDIRSALKEGTPNPFGRTTTLRFTLEVPGDAALLIFDVAGRAVRSFDLEGLSIGEHSITWDGRNHAGEPLPSGVYFYQLLNANGTREAKRLIKLN